VGKWREGRMGEARQPIRKEEKEEKRGRKMGGNGMER
jgi:hypothetical protein